ncbi:MAG: hypothetical protein ABIJ40_09515 [Bacteroidota bacterium]
MTTFDSSFNITHTQGDTFDKTITVEENGLAINWAASGYASGKCYVKQVPSSLTADLILNVNIGINGQMRLYSTGAVTLSPDTYYYDIQLTKTDTSIVTWLELKRFKVIQDVTT